MKTQSLCKVNIPDGSYKGFWTGYNVVVPFSDPDHDEKFEVMSFCKADKLPVYVYLLDGLAEVKAI